MAITNLTGTTWLLNKSIARPTPDCADEFDITGTATDGTYTVDVKSLRFTLMSGGTYCMFIIHSGPVGTTYGSFFRGSSWEYYDRSWYACDPPTLAITGGADVTNEVLIAYLEANATQVVETTPTEITYNGATTSLGAGQTAILSCAGKKATTDIVIAFGADGTITYNGTDTDVSAGQTATMECVGKKMLTDVVVAMSSGSTLKIVSWADGTDEQIAAMVAALDDGTISIEDTGWAVGDERKVTLAAMAATGVGETHVEQTVTLVLMDSQHYTLTKATAGGDTKDHFVVGMKNMLANGTTREGGYMNSSNTNSGSWSGCARRAWCNDVFRAAIPETLRGCFKQFKVPTATTHNGYSVTETDDYFALFAEKEIFGSRTYSNTTEANALSQIKWYETAANRIKKDGDAGSAGRWWERSPFSDGDGSFCGVSSAGAAYSGGASYDYGLAPFGCI